MNLTKYSQPLCCVAIALLTTSACTNPTTTNNVVKTDTIITQPLAVLYVPDSIDIQGHRGMRGLYPENTIAGFIKALQLGVNTLEMDVVTSHDNKLVVSHEAYMRAEICTINGAVAIDTTNEKQHNIYQLNYDSIAQYDCGSKAVARFPYQQKVVEHKPLLRSVLLAVVEYCTKNNMPIPNFNIEIKTDVANDGVLHPNPAIVAKALYDELYKLHMLSTVTIQSFDVRALQAMKRIDSQVTISLLVENKLSLEQNLAALKFMPQLYSCDYALVTPELLANAHTRHLKVIPWTVNDTATAAKLLRFGVDGIITDYPNIIKHK